MILWCLLVIAIMVLVVMFMLAVKRVVGFVDGCFVMCFSFIVIVDSDNGVFWVYLVAGWLWCFC